MAYKPIEMSKLYVETCLYDTDNNKVANTVYESILRTSILVGQGILLSEEELKEQLVLACVKNNLKDVDPSLKSTLDAFAKAKRSQGFLASSMNMVDTLLLPFAFEEWQKNKIVLNINDDIADFLKNNTEFPANPASMKILPSVVYINSPFEENGGTLVLTSVIKDADDVENVVVNGWSFNYDNPSAYVSHFVSFKDDPSKKGAIVSLHKPEDLSKMCATYIYGIMSLFGTGLFIGRMTETTQKTYKQPSDVTAPKNKFSEVKEFDLFFEENFFKNYQEYNFGEDYGDND